MATQEELENLLSILFTNMNNLDNVYYDMFINTTPMDITLERYDSDGELQEYVLPNRAKDANYIKQGSGSPIGVVTGNAGTLYLDIANYVLYFKSVGTDSFGWVKIYAANKFVAGTDYVEPDGNGSQITNLNASNISSGVTAVSYGGTGATNITGIVKGNGASAFTAAVSNVDYVANLLPRFAVNTAPINSTTGQPNYLSGIGTSTLTLTASSGSPLSVTYANSSQKTITTTLSTSLASLTGTYIVSLNNYLSPTLTYYSSSSLFIQPNTPTATTGFKWLDTSVRPAVWKTYTGSAWTVESTTNSYSDVFLALVTAVSGTITNITYLPLNHNFIDYFNNDVINLGTVSSGNIYLAPNTKYWATCSASTLITLPKVPMGQEVNVMLDLKVSNTSYTFTWSETIYWIFANPPTLTDTTQTYDILLTYTPATNTWEGRWGAKTL